ncbi:hypothetical protein [Methylobacterium sp. NEAU K]|uniref:hypothetical protein n=1 Tax=Methylobacterium sp. NEAU K TaxID=3064946 RepID=UPI002733CE3A|nr:hypothetical protein [Methylobacterium sp. NEAU K]MDP4003339.1 hypothetical protein [Methylobacterium sp. NEAU K]
MNLVFQSTDIRTVRRVAVPVRLEARNDARPGLVTDIGRYRTIGSLQALGLAIAASIVTPPLIWLAL